ncbi:MAG: hypothetical protein ACI8X5_004282 [Planctomycetota bacterium]|jgi:hypothetical protein
MRLSDARKALLGGQPEYALDCLADPCLIGLPEAEKLRARVVDVLCREAARMEQDGRGSASLMLFARVSEYDPALARAWRRRLDGEARGIKSGPTSVVRSGAQTGIVTALEKLLGEMRGERGPTPKSGRSAESQCGARSQDSLDGLSMRGKESDRSFKLAIDDIGEFFCVHGSDLTLGHARAECADLPFMADIDSLQVRLIRTESFHAGPGWRIEPIEAQPISISGQIVDPGGVALFDGDEVQLAANLAFVFRHPETASGTALLELLHGTECGGCPRVLLFAPGTAGRLRITTKRDRELYARRLKQDVSLWVDGDQLVVESGAELRARGGDVATRPPAGEGSHGGLMIPCPPRERVDVVVGRGGPDGPPFGFSVTRAVRHDSGGVRS